MKQKKVWFAALCGITLLSACGGVVKKERKCGREEMGLVGKVQILVETSMEGDGTMYTFNEAGNLISEKHVSEGMDMDQEEKLMAEYAYNEDGKLLSVSRFSNINGSLDIKDIYDARGHKIAVEKYSNGSVHSTQHFIYNDKGLLVKSYMNDDEKNVSEFECDAAGNVLNQTDFFNGKVSRILRFSYKYDSRGNITEKCDYTPEIPGVKKPDTGKVKEKKEYKYDENDFMLEQKQSSYTHDGKRHYLKHERFFKYTLDAHHNQVEVISSSCTYPEPEAEQQEKRCSDNSPITMTYAYDENGNWTSRERMRDGETTYTFRSITYFE